MARVQVPDAVVIAMNDHEYVMTPLSGKSHNLEIAVTYIRQILRKLPAYAWQLDRAITEIEDAKEAIHETQTRAVERWRNNFH